jgi:hypothetical protein
MSATHTKEATASTSETIDKLSKKATEATEATSEIIDEVCQEAMGCYEKCGEEFVGTFNRMSNQTIDLFEKMLGVYQATSVPDAQRRVQVLIESSLSALRVNVESALNMNAKIIDSWKELAGIVSAREVILELIRTRLAIKQSSKEITLAGSVEMPRSESFTGTGGAENTPGNHCRITHPNRKIEMSVSAAANSTPTPARCKDVRRRCRNHWKRQAEVRRPPPKRRAPDRDRGGASSVAESQWPSTP